MKRIAFLLLLFCVTASDGIAQTDLLNWPIERNTSGSGGYSSRTYFFSSSFGPRNLANSNDYNLVHPHEGLDDEEDDDFIDDIDCSVYGSPNYCYNYDFHRGTDIISSTSSTTPNAQYGDDVVAIDSGRVVFLAGQSLIIRTTNSDFTYSYWRYLHIDPDVVLDQDIDGGEVIGTIDDIAGPHLDLKYYPELQIVISLFLVL
ncbi:MAG: hypothetical protein WD361_13955 [Gracilimonas sp.]